MNINIPSGVFGKHEEGDRIEYISEQEVWLLLWNIHNLLPIKCHSYRSYNDGALFSITNYDSDCECGMRKEDAISIKIYFNYGYIGISDFQMSGPPDRVLT